MSDPMNRYHPIVSVLFIENDVDIARTFVDELTKRQIYAVWVETLEEATKLLESVHVDLIVSDGMFPLHPGGPETKGFLALMDYLEQRSGERPPIIAWSNSTHVHEHTRAHGIESFSKFELTREQWVAKGRAYIEVTTLTPIQMADHVVDRLVEQSGFAATIVGKQFVNYYQEPLTVLAGFMAFDMRTSMFAKTAGLNYGPLITEFNDGVGTVYVDPARDAQIADSIYRKIVDEQFFPEIETGVGEQAAALRELSKKLAAADFRAASANELAADYQEFTERFMQMRTYSSLPTAMEHETNRWTDHLTKILRQKAATDEDFNRAFSLLTTPERPSYVNEYEIAVAKLGLAELEDGVTPTDRPQLIKDWAWIKYSFEGDWLTNQDVDEKLAALGSTAEALRSFIEQFAARPAKLRADKEAASKRYQLTPAEIEAFRIGSEIVSIKFFRKGIFAQAYYSVEFLLEAIGERIGATRRQVVNMLPAEVIAALTMGQFPTSIIDDRVKSSVLFSHHGRTFSFPPSIQSMYESSLVRPAIQAALKGQTAYSGVVSGTVRIVNVPSDMGKLSEGEILVSRSTNPALVPAMRRAAAFVTDLGGLTCHAAIVAREMKKPCVVGTKAATLQLHDGDRVTVNADRGTITIEEVA